MTWTPTHKKLRITLAELYGDKASAQRLATEAGMNITDVTFSDNAADNWFEIIKKAEDQGCLISLIKQAQEAYKTNETLQQVLQELQASEKNASPKETPLSADHISVSRLPVTSRNLFGRDAELQLLDDAWANPNLHILAFIAWGGVGKTALVNHWLKQRMARDNYLGAERVYGWSFFSQGTSGRAASADLFINQALSWFGDPDPTLGSPWDKGERLAGLIRKTRTLLILDGLEPLQHPPGPQEGQVKDAALQAFLVELAARQQGLCVISTRERVGDLVEFENGTVVQHELEYLTPQAGRQILRALNVKGEDGELEETAEELDGHAFSLTLLGSYLDEVFNGDIRRRKEIESLFDETQQGDKAQKMIAAYEAWLGEGVELATLRLLGLFDRPADAACIAALRAAPAIPELTEALQNLKESKWQQALSKLRRLKLLASKSESEPDTLDAHPLMREYFKQQLKNQRNDAWREANNRLYEHLTQTTKDLPDTIEEMAPLFAAVAHGCAAGRLQEVFEEVYRRLIQRGEDYFDLHVLGAFGDDLTALSGFFAAPWHQPVAELTESQKVLSLGIAGFNLRALGRLPEAAQPMQAGLAARLSQKDWDGAAVTAGNLSELYLTLGNLRQALQYAEQSVELADRGNDERQRINRLSLLACVFHHLGRIENAVAAFREAEEVQQRLLETRFLYAMRGFYYCALLLGQGQMQEVRERATWSLDLSKRHTWPLERALDNLSLGCVGLLEAQHTGTSDTSQAAKFLQCAVEGLRQTKQIDRLPLGLLARAALHRFNSKYSLAERDLNEVLRIATRGGMKLHLADYHLEAARLHLAQGNQDKARDHFTTAKTMIVQMEYHRRDNELNELAKQLPDAPPTDS